MRSFASAELLLTGHAPALLPRSLRVAHLRRQAVAQLLRAERWADATAMLLRFAASCDGAGARNSQCKAYLGAVVVWLYAGKAKDAWITYQVRRGGEGRSAWRPACSASAEDLLLAAAVSWK